MSKTVLLTSFTVWEAHHTSNSSDDLLARLGPIPPLALHLLRKLPVDFRQAPRQVLDRFRSLQPDITVLCGMAQAREGLQVESRAVVKGDTCINPLDLEALTADLPATTISDDAGRFVCNELYYRMLRHHRDQGLRQPCLFVHVPCLTQTNTRPIVADFETLVRRLAALSPPGFGNPGARGNN